MLVLWIVIVLGAIASGVVVAARRQTALVGAVRSRTVARYAAQSGIVAAAHELQALFRAAEGPEAQVRVYGLLEETLQGWGERPLGADARYQVAVADLGARIDLNQANEDVLRGLFTQFVGEDDAAALVDALEDWKYDDNEPREQGAEAAEYLAAGSPIQPRSHLKSHGRHVSEPPNDAAWKRRSTPMYFGIASRPTCSTPVRICGPFSYYWGTATWSKRLAIFTYRNDI